jgi:hypothetical protein
VTAIAACRACGTEPLEHARFCHGCGSPFNGSIALATRESRNATGDPHEPSAPLLPSTARADPVHRRWSLLVLGLTGSVPAHRGYGLKAVLPWTGCVVLTSLA